MKVIWLGEDTEDIPGPSFTTCYGLKFPKDVSVEVTDPDMVRRAKGNLMFKVLDEGKQQQETSHGESQTQNKEQTEIKEQKDQGTGYSPVKKKVRKKKAEDKPADAATT